MDDRLPGPFGLGLAALGRPGYINLGHGDDVGDDRSVDALRTRAHAVLDAAHAAGVRYLDAARSYGRAEEFLAQWLAARPDGGAADVVVGSKWGYTYTAGWSVDAEHHEIKDLGPHTFDRQLAETRALLGDHLRLYQIHSATLESGVLDDTDVLARLADLREQGIAVGLTTTGPHQSDTIRRAVDLDAFDTVQATWNLLEPSAGRALAEAADAGLQVIVKEAVANGRLTPRGGPAVSPVAARAAELGVTPDALALAAALARPWATVVLSGAATPDQLTSNLAATDIAWDDDLEDWAAALPEAPDRYWRTRADLAWN